MIQNKSRIKIKKTFSIGFYISIFFLLPSANSTENTALEADIFTQSNYSIQQFVIPENFYSKAENNRLDQISIVDKFGAKLPYEISKHQSVVRNQKRSIKVFALKDSQYLERQIENISLKYDSENRLIEVNKDNGLNETEIVKGYILDLGEKFPRIDSNISFQLSSVSDTRFLKFNIDKSSNLKNWRLVSKGEVLAQLVHQDVVTQHRTITLKNVRKRYLRLTIQSNHPPFKIYSAEQNFSTETPLNLTWTSLKEMHFNEKEQGYLLELAPSVSYRTLKLEMPKAPSIITGTVSSRVNSKSRWLQHGAVNFINLDNGNTRILENQLHLWAIDKTQLKLASDYSSPLLNKQSIWVKLAFEPNTITFFANGNEPYKIQLGQMSNPESNENNPALMATIKRQSGNVIGLATLGNSRSIKVDESLDSSINWRKIILWIVLIVGVVLMAWMAKNLLKQMD